MDIKGYMNGEEVESFHIKEPLTEILVKRLLKEGNLIRILTKSYQIGNIKMVLGAVDIDDSCEVHITEDGIKAKVYYPYAEFPQLEGEPNTRVIKRNGHTVVEAISEIKKENIMLIICMKAPRV